jgi:hypothetical protein
MVIEEATKKIDELKTASTKEMLKICELEESVMKIKKSSTTEPNVKQIDIQVNIKEETIEALVDCGADVDYASEAWCIKKEFPIKELGRGWMEGYDGKQTRTKLRDAEIEFKFDGVIQKRNFRVIKETGTDRMVLGMPWLHDWNPAIDWRKRTVALRKEASKDTGGENGTPAPRARSSKNLKKASQKESEQAPDQRKRGGYGGDQTDEKARERDYQQRLKETREKLPDELKDYAEVFCQRK